MLVQDIKIITTGTSVAGENYSVLCIADVYDNLPDIVVNTSIVKIGEGVVNTSINSGDNSVSISYTPLMTSHSGLYQCVVNISHIDISYQVSYFEAFTINSTSKIYCMPIIKINYINHFISQSLLPVWLSEGVLPLVLSMRVLTLT